MFGKVKGYFLVLGKRKKMNCETRKRGKLCGKEECESCFSRSFASCDKAKYMVEGQGNPLLIQRGSTKKFSFVCSKCEHSFKKSPNEVTSGYFCAFCSTQKLCGRGDRRVCFEKSFANHEKVRCWCFEKNKLNPIEVFMRSGKKCWFNCEKCGHTFEVSPHNISKGTFCPFCPNRKLCDSGDCKMCFEKSFANHEKAKYWSLEKNKKAPREVFANSDKKSWFKCGECDHSFLSRVADVSKGSFCPFCPGRSLCFSIDCRMCFEKSFEKHEKAKFWSSDRNKLSPRQVSAGSHEKFWFECEECDHSFKMSPKCVSIGQFCPFCSNNKMCLSEKCDVCFRKSFSNHEKAKFWSFQKNKKTPREVFMHSNKKYWFDCNKCNHSFESSPDKIFVGRFCPFCSGEKLCISEGCDFCFKKSFASHEKSVFWNYERNKTIPREIFSKSEKKCWFRCAKKHEFSSVLRNVSNGSWCPKCRNKTECKLFSFLEGNFAGPVHQFRVSWCKNPETGKFLPFDFCVGKTIIELDGKQHYEQVSNWQSPELTQKNDRYKENCAIKNGYSVLRILQEDVWKNKIDWKELLLDNIKDYETPIVKCLWEGGPCENIL